jgi:hypothetical protein
MHYAQERKHLPQGRVKGSKIAGESKDAQGGEKCCGFGLDTDTRPKAKAEMI